MTYENIQYDINSSLLKMCKDFISSNSLSDFDVFDFDAHASLNDLPHKNLVGIAEYSVMEMVDQYEGNAMAIISTKQDDSNLKVLKPLISKLFNRLKTDSTIDVVSSDTGVRIGMLKITQGTEAMSVMRTKSRPLQSINFSFVLTLLSP